MKKRFVAAVCGVMMAAMLMTGCQASKGLKNDNLEITQYNGVQVDAVEKPEEVTEEEIDNYIESARSTYPAEVTDRPVQDGDTVDINFVGTVDGVAFDGGSADNFSMTVGAGQMIEGFEESAIGHSIGETYVWDGAFPEEYPNNPDLAGKACQFTITINAISELPEVTDEWVQKVSEESQTVDEYRDEIKKNMEEQKQSSYDSSLSSAVWEKVVENTTVKEYPQDKIDELKDKYLQQVKDAAEQAGMEYEEYVQSAGQMTVEDLEAKYEESAKNYQKQVMIVEAIAEKEKISVADKDYQDKLKEWADAEGTTVDELIENYGEEELKFQALVDPVFEWLREHCVQVAK